MLLNYKLDCLPAAHSVLFFDSDNSSQNLQYGDYIKILKI